MQKMTKGGRTSNIRRVWGIAFDIPKIEKKKKISIANYQNHSCLCHKTSVLWDVYTYVQVVESSTKNKLFNRGQRNVFCSQFSRT